MARIVAQAFAGALIALPLVAAGPALAKHHHKEKAESAKEKVDTTAYPTAPGGMPAAGDKGKPVEPKADAGAKPGPSGKASTEGTAEKIGTPTTAYPGAPGGTPSAGDGGKPVK